MCIRDRQQAQQTYNDLKQQTPKMPVLSDFTESSADYSWGISDGSDADDSDGEDSSSSGYDSVSYTHLTLPTSDLV